MRERPILFSAPMVRAILAGTKTQTRRLVKDTGLYAIDAKFHGIETAARELARLATRCPYGTPGDRLWVRETWRVCGGREYEYQQDRSQVMYRATHHEDGFPLGWESYDWRPSIFMPRWASRITLEITGVRVERLQDISEMDAQAEGLMPLSSGADRTWTVDGDAASEHEAARDTYAWLWEQINGAGSWDANPWAWVVEFKRAEAGHA